MTTSANTPHEDWASGSDLLDRMMSNELALDYSQNKDLVISNSYPQLSDKQKYNLRGNILNAFSKTKLTLSWNHGGKRIQRRLGTVDIAYAAWVLASSYSANDRLGGTNSPIALMKPARFWSYTDYDRIEKVIRLLLEVKNLLNLEISLSDLIVFGGNCAIEKAISNFGHHLDISFQGGRSNINLEHSVLDDGRSVEPIADGFLNWTKDEQTLSAANWAEGAEYLFLEKSLGLSLGIGEAFVLFSGFKSMGLVHRESAVLPLFDYSSGKERLGTDFVRLLPKLREVEWSPVMKDQDYRAAGIFRGSVPYAETSVSRVDLLIMLNPEFQKLADFYNSRETTTKFLNDFVSAWSRVMLLGCTRDTAPPSLYLNPS